MNLHTNPNPHTESLTSKEFDNEFHILCELGEVTTRLNYLTFALITLCIAQIVGIVL